MTITYKRAHVTREQWWCVGGWDREKKRVNKFTIRDRIDNNNVYTWGGEHLGTVRAMSRPNHHLHFHKKNQFPPKLIILYLYLQFMLSRSFTHTRHDAWHTRRVGLETETSIWAERVVKREIVMCPRCQRWAVLKLHGAQFERGACSETVMWVHIICRELPETLR